MRSKGELREAVRDDLDRTVDLVNKALRGEGLAPLEPILTRIGRGGRLPHWFDQLRSRGSLPNLDGKTVGSVIEMLLVAVLEAHILTARGSPKLSVNPARGVDLPDLDLGVKSPSENFCTSEPYFSAYDRLLGSDYDVLTLLTDYQSAKKKRPFRLQIKAARYLHASQVADENLCHLARYLREFFGKKNEAWLLTSCCFLAYVNQSDWRAKQILKMMACIDDSEAVWKVLESAAADFKAKNRALLADDREPIPDAELEALKSAAAAEPVALGVVDASHNWVQQTLQDAGRMPNANEARRILASPLDGMIGMSFALQWRYNFSRLFPKTRKARRK